MGASGSGPLPPSGGALGHAPLRLGASEVFLVPARLCSWPSGRSPELPTLGKSPGPEAAHQHRLLGGEWGGESTQATLLPTPLPSPLPSCCVSPTCSRGMGRDQARARRPSGWCAGPALCSRLRGQDGRGPRKCCRVESRVPSELPQEPQEALASTPPRSGPRRAVLGERALGFVAAGQAKASGLFFQ